MTQQETFRTCAELTNKDAPAQAAKGINELPREFFNENPEHYIAIANIVQDLVFIVAPDYRVEYVNDFAANLIGVAPNQLLGKTILELFPQKLAQRMCRNIERAIREAQPLTIEDKYVLPKGEFWFSSRLVPVFDAQGAIRWVFGVSRDISERVRFEETLRDREMTLRRITNNLPALIGHIDPRERFSFANRTWGDWLGFSPATIIGKTVREAVGEEIYACIGEDIATALSGREVCCEREFTPRHGGNRFISVALMPHQNAVYETIGCYILIMDITPRKRAEEHTRRSEARYRSLFQNSPFAILELDCAETRLELERLRQECGGNLRAFLIAHPQNLAAGLDKIHILDANQAATQTELAKTLDAVVAQLRGSAPRHTLNFAVEGLMAIADGLARHEGELIVAGPDKKARHYFMRFVVPPDQLGSYSHVIATTIDLTALKRAQEEAARGRREAQLQRAEMLAATGQLAAGVAHEINNPLQVIKGQIRLLRDELPDAQAHAKRLKYISDGIDHIARITYMLLDLNREEQTGEASCDVEAVIRGLMELTATQLQRNRVEVSASVSGENLAVSISAKNLTQVLLNLVLNAKDAMPRGGHIAICARSEDGAVIISVSDDGVGIPAENRARIFSPFFTTKGKEGTGLGLSVAHEIVVAAGGRIEVESAADNGSTFSVWLPRNSAHNKITP